MRLEITVVITFGLIWVDTYKISVTNISISILIFKWTLGDTFGKIFDAVVDYLFNSNLKYY